MTDLGARDASRAIQAARELDNALLPAVGEYDDGTLITDIQAWKDAGAAAALQRTRQLIDRALKNLR